jgi:hypothetical protein
MAHSSSMAGIYRNLNSIDDSFPYLPLIPDASKLIGIMLLGKLKIDARKKVDEEDFSVADVREGREWKHDEIYKSFEQLFHMFCVLKYSWNMER